MPQDVGEGGRGRGRPRVSRAETEEAAALAEWLHVLTRGLNIRQLAERFPYNKTKWAQFLNGSQLIPSWLLEQVVRERVREEQLQKKMLAHAADLLDRAERAAAGKLPAVPRNLPDTQLREQLEEARRGQVQAQKTLMGMTQMVLLLLSFIASLRARCEEVDEEAGEALARAYRMRVTVAEGQLKQAEGERAQAEELRLQAHLQSERYRRALQADHTAVTVSGAVYDVQLPPLEVEECDRLLARNAEHLKQARHDLDDLRTRLGLPAIGETRIVRGQVVDDSEARSGAGIVATLGPATDTPERLTALIASGMSMARLNLRHGTYAEHAQLCHRIREAAARAGRRVGVLADLPGPQIRLGIFMEGPVFLEGGEAFILTTEDVQGNNSICSTPHMGLPNDVAVGDPILLKDGSVELEVTAVEGTRVITTVTTGGTLSGYDRIHLPAAHVSAPALTPKGIEDLRRILRLGVDVVAVSFVRDARDVEEVHRVMDEEGRRLPVLAKVEKRQALENLEEIVEAFDGIMVARGDLAVEVSLEQVPLAQKRAVQLASQRAKAVIVAAQLLESMITNAQPTRAETNDVANSVLDGADALMLSAATSVGAHPAETVKTMSRIIAAAQENMTASGLSVARGIPASWLAHPHQTPRGYHTTETDRSDSQSNGETPAVARDMPRRVRRLRDWFRF